jgi:hypothetical protein
MQVYLAPLVSLVGLILYLLASSGGEKPSVPPKLATIGLIMFAAGLLAALLRLDASSFRLH